MLSRPRSSSSSDMRSKATSPSSPPPVFGDAIIGTSYAELSKNGVVQFGQNVFVPPVATRAVNYIAKSYWNEGMFQGDIAEIILYNRKLTAQENAAVKAYIAGKYGLSMTP